jgi:hypothetical protein
VVATVLLALPVLTAGLLAASARLPSLVSTLLVAYLALVCELVGVTWVLSPFDAVTRTGLAVCEAVLFAGALAVWMGRGRPRPPLAAARRAARAIFRDGASFAFLCATAVVLAYELLLALASRPNNWDALTYHLARAAAWLQHGGIHWIDNAPSGRLNEFQPLAEQEVLFLFVSAGDDRFYALPQYLAQLAILLAVYGASRRLGFSYRAAACSAFLLATFSLVALESVTAQNDLVAASFPVVAACLALGGAPVEIVLAGSALGLGLGAKVTTLLVWPVLALLIASRGRRAVLLSALGAGAAFLAFGCWGYVLNWRETGHPLGRATEDLRHATTLPFRESLETGLYLLYRLLDLSVLSDRLIVLLACAGAVAGALVWFASWRRGRARTALLDGVAVGLALLAPALVFGAATTMAFVTRVAGIPVEGAAHAGAMSRFADEDVSAFGPVGAVAVLGVPLLVTGAYVLRRADLRRLALGLALPVFAVLLAMTARYNIFLPRFALVPAVLTAPLFGYLFRDRRATAAILLAAILSVGLTLESSSTKPFDARPWAETQAEALAHTWQPSAGASLAALGAHLPTDACVGAVLGPDEPGHLLWGPALDRRIVFLSVEGAFGAARSRGLVYVVISGGSNRWAADDLRTGGWTVVTLDGGYWLLAIAPGAGDVDCTRP